MYFDFSSVAFAALCFGLAPTVFAFGAWLATARELRVVTKNPASPEWLTATQIRYAFALLVFGMGIILVPYTCSGMAVTFLADVRLKSTPALYWVGSLPWVATIAGAVLIVTWHGQRFAAARLTERLGKRSLAYACALWLAISIVLNFVYQSLGDEPILIRFLRSSAGG